MELKKVSEHDVRSIAENVRIELAEDNVPAMVTYLNNMIESLEPMLEIDTEGAQPTYHPLAGLTNVMREDVVEPSLPREKALQDAPSVSDGYFKIPSILGGGDA